MTPAAQAIGQKKAVAALEGSNASFVGENGTTTVHATVQDVSVEDQHQDIAYRLYRRRFAGMLGLVRSTLLAMTPISHRCRLR